MIVLTDIVRQYFCLIMTLRDVWRGPVSWLMTHDNHRSHLQAITHRISPHHRLMILALSTLVSLASLHYYPGPGWLRCRMMSPGCHMSDMSHCDRPLSRNYVKCPDKNPSWGARESRDPQGDGEWLSQLVWVWQLLPRHNTDTGMNICLAVFLSF